MRAAGLAKLGPLSELLVPTELRRVADSLAIDGVARRAVRTLAPEKRAAAEEHVAAVLSAFGSREAVAATLRVIASTVERTPSPPTLVWSGPQLPGDSVRTTAAVVRLIDEAEESVLASTYSGTATAPFVQALRRAAQRRLAITVVCDVSQRRDCAEAIRGAVPRARVLGYCDPETGQPRMQHSKVLVIDDRAALVTSANLSYAAVELNLEAGVLIEDFALASQITRRFADLLAAGNLQDLA
jgi:phosphatidylserine/phosphatidylglycerophosphate/cardiolipin synthase-like enzyme